MISIQGNFHFSVICFLFSKACNHINLKKKGSTGTLETYKLTSAQLMGETNETKYQVISSHNLQIYDMKNIKMIGGYKDSLIILVGLNPQIQQCRLFFFLNFI